jgi:hypothetical protein
VNGTLLRRAAIFTTVAGLGLLLAWMLGGRRTGVGRSKPSIGIVDVPPGTDLMVASGLADISLVRAEKLVVAPVHEVTLDDGTKVPFRSMVLRGDSEHPLPSPRRDVRRAFLTNPDLQLLPVPRTRAEYDASSTAVPTTIHAIEGVLDSGPGEAMVLRFKGEVKARSVRDGAPWDFAGDDGVSDVQARTLHAPGAVSLVSKDLRVQGRDLDAAEDARTVLLAGGASGSVDSARGVRIAGGAQGGATRFRCSGPFRILPLPAPGGATGKIERWRLVLDQDARLEQDDGDLAGRHIEADISRRKGDADSDTVVDEIRADGDAVLTGRGEGRDFRATGRKLLARPQAKGNTDVWLDGSPTVFVRESQGGREVRTLDVRGDGSARLSFPSDDGPVSSDFRGGATAVMTEPPAAPGEAPRRRDLHAASLSLAGMRAGSGVTRIESVVADGESLLHDGDRTARAKRIEFHPLENGASRTVLAGDVLFTWPAAGAMDPVAVLAPAPSGPPAAEAAQGTMLLSSPGRAVIEQPADGDRSTGTLFTVEGGTMLRRVAGEQEVYRLTCSSLEARTPPGSKGIDALRAKGAVRLAGREERPGGRRYELRGEGLDVRGTEGTDGARTADVEGTPEGTALAAFTGEDGRPFSVSGRTLHFDRASGAFRAEGFVRGSGVLPERHGEGSGLPASAGGAADLACGVLDGMLAQGGPEGSTKVTSLDARDNVWVRTETEYASGDHLVYDAAKGSLLLHGDPARVTARSRGAPANLDLQDRCEAPEMLLALADGRLEEARTETGGLLVRHRPPEPGAGKDAPPVQRIEARCRGPLSYRPAETRLQGAVRVVRSDLKDGAFVEKDRLENADDVRVYHPPVGKESGRVDRATAVSADGRIEVSSAAAGWRATGVARADMDVASDRVTLESSPGAPRFRMESADGVQSYRRAVYDYQRKILVESLGATIESGR